MKQPKQNKPFIIEGEKKNYAWCACGKTGSAPYCDGTHMKPLFSKIK